MPHPLGAHDLLWQAAVLALRDGILVRSPLLSSAMSTASPPAPPTPRDVARRPIDYLLAFLTLLGLVLYAPLARLFVALHRQLDEKDAIWLGPLAVMCLAVAMGLVWLLRGGATRRGRLAWACLVMLGLLGWAPSCMYGAIVNYKGPLLFP